MQMISCYLFKALLKMYFQDAFIKYQTFVLEQSNLIKIVSYIQNIRAFRVFRCLKNNIRVIKT
jgi:hypothetical protein